MALHFTEQELKSRRDRVVAELQASGLAALLIFRQESMYYLTGYDTTGYSQFQCLYLGADGRMVLLTRSADLRQARLTSVVEDIRIWVDRAGVDPGQDLWAILEEQGCRGRKVGVELEAWCLTGKRWEYVRAAMEGKCDWEDQSDLVSRLRLVKSDAEIEYVRQAAALADEAWLAAQRTATAGTPEQDVLAAMTSAVFQGGGDYTATRFIIGSGENALMVRNFTGYRTLGDNDQLQLEFGGAYRHYHACPDAHHPDWRARPAPRGHARRLRRGVAGLQGRLPLPAPPSATSSRPMPIPSTAPGSANTSSTPAATAWAHSTRRRGWTGR